ncbi:Biotin carboxyl carrier protein [Actinacidiphila yanglinensis]|uniref:Biotin carboxyl carrier protein n=1 Tax=Actinacidiphila yanglinensis TaxID=310779 RepID=A0A1H6DDN8_9ACTN|nr:HlyD family efflux transporter periplasmic adaptor subunit [Actinacidiphila yanglinensis]SEG83458.1 Biotin carboxyl carrier protein [Actinacidiphila yanglinensis]
MQFRQKALDKLDAPEELDIPVRFARPQGRLALAVAAVVLAAATFWAVTGTVSSKLTAPGILTRVQGSYVLQSPFAGQVTEVYAKEGDEVASGARLLSVRTATAVEAVRAVAAGRVTALTAKIGSVVATGADLATLEHADTPNDPLVAVLYAQGGSASSIVAGAAVDLTVQTVPTQAYGVLRGRVLAVGRVPETRQQITSFLGDEQLGEQFSAKGQPVAVVVQLNRSSHTRSGYTWSSTSGPPYTVDSRTLISGAVHLAAQHPIDWVKP